MKKALILLAAAAALAVSCNCNNDLQTRVSELENRQQLKNLVDTFSVLADVKDTDTQGLLFTEDGAMKTMQNGVEVFSIDGRESEVLWAKTETID